MMMTQKIVDKQRARKILVIAVAIIAAFITGLMLRGGSQHNTNHKSAIDHPQSQVTQWVCSMHPQFKLPERGKCPICFMDLIPMDSGDDDDGDGIRELSVSENAAHLMDIETVAVERRSVTANVRMVGKVDYDETRLTSITAWVPGRLDRLFVDYTGISVEKGDKMISLYSPELISAQEELLQAIVAVKKLEKSDILIVRDATKATVDAVREKLRLWGLTPEQIANVEQSGKIDEHMTIYAPTGGVVIEKSVQEGLYVQKGTKIYTIADLSHLWINLDAYESDLIWLRLGQKVKFTIEAYPGENFDGTVDFIHPMLNDATHTVKVRVNVSNKEKHLKPGMFVRAVVETRPKEDDNPLVIPVSAPLLTGKRAIVYLAVTGKDRPTFEGREIELGSRAGDYYIVKEGLKEGEQIVTRGAFKIDAELQIRAKPSMMMPEGGVTSNPHAGHDMQQMQTTHQTNKSAAPQTLCPIMGGEINKEIYVDYNGMRIYFCCAGCSEPFLADAEKHLTKMKANGIEPEKIEVVHEH